MTITLNNNHIAGKYINQVTVAIPRDLENPNAKKFSINLLGQNVLEYFNYYMDTSNDRIYFFKNHNPKPISDDTMCGTVFTSDDNSKMHSIAGATI